MGNYNKITSFFYRKMAYLWKTFHLVVLIETSSVFCNLNF